MSNYLREDFYLDVDALMEKCRFYGSRENVLMELPSTAPKTTDTDEEDVENEGEGEELSLNLVADDDSSIDIFKYEMYKMCIERIMSADTQAIQEMTNMPSFADRIALNTLKETGIIKEI